jgi:HD-GYP domain-containing protein (c-di-GMP phosphodiesterase class II)
LRRGHGFEGCTVMSIAELSQGESCTREHAPLLPIAVQGLCPTSVLEFDLFILTDPAKPAVLYRQRSLPLQQDDLNRLLERGVHTLYMRAGEEDSYRRYLRKEVVQNERIPPGDRYKILREATRSIFETALHSHNLDRVVPLSADFGKQMTDLICHEGMVLGHLVSLMQHDYYTYNHVVNVSTYAVILANKLTMKNRDELYAIAAGALLHDLGKQQIELDILQKPGKLTTGQQSLMKQHPRLGFEQLCFREDLTWGQLMMIYQHHERPDGNGYPVGVTAEDIHPWSKICAVTDVFDALTTVRPYRQAESHASASAYLRQEAGKGLEQEMVQCWTKLMQNETN